MLRPDPGLTERFRRDLEALTGEPPAAERRLGLAVSGGPDSMAMLLLAAAAWPGAVRAATVDHGLRPEAAGEAAQVGSLCARLGVEHAILRVACDGGGNLQERAREARYDALRLWAEGATPWVAVAHHRDDVAETLLMRARRGAGVAGLAAMRAVRPLAAARRDGAWLVRPLLGWSREELARITASAGIEAVRDPSNRAGRFDRARIRALLAASPELPPSRLARAARNLRDADDAIEWMMASLAAERFGYGDGTVDFAAGGLPHELLRRCVRLAIGGVRASGGLPPAWRESGVDRLIATLERGGTGTVAGVQARAAGGRWHFRLAPPRRSH